MTSPINNKMVVLTVDDTPMNLDLLHGILSTDYEVKAAINGHIALKIAENLSPDIILLDIMMPEMDGYEVCKKLKSNPKTVNIPVIFVTAMLAPEDQQRGFDAGAVDYITKPVHPGIVKARVKTHLALANQQKACKKIVELQTHELQENQKAAIYMLGEAGHYNDTDTGAHIWRMAAYSTILAHAADWSVSKVDMLRLSAPMHDTGKIGIPDEILKAPRKLTAEEWVIMKTHTNIGHKILNQSQVPIFFMAQEIALSHHEKWDGTGYPEGISGKEIPESARIVAIADVFDALTMKRPYKEPWPVEKAFDVIKQDSGSHFDPVLSQLFLDNKNKIIQTMDEWNANEKSPANL
ncbi:MAG: response regulator [gamma proteobacterium symbiont of Taylorina sp.]|nr:response regulator [gamma proteobacterium symbiont of Taylorina sp.]